MKQKIPTISNGYIAIKFVNRNPAMYTKLASDHPIDLCCYQVLNCYSGRISMINFSGESLGAPDFSEAIKTAVINKRAEGAEMIMEKKRFKVLLVKVSNSYMLYKKSI
nr:hypothetical protein [Flavobacterium fryxellicola]